MEIRSYIRNLLVDHSVKDIQHQPSDDMGALTNVQEDEHWEKEYVTPLEFGDVFVTSYSDTSRAITWKDSIRVMETILSLSIWTTN